jgi:hypothetical protein
MKTFKRTIQIREREIENSKTLSEYLKTLEKICVENSAKALIRIDGLFDEKIEFEKLENLNDDIALKLFKNSNKEIDELFEDRYQVFPNLKIEENSPDSYLLKVEVKIKLM